MPPRSMLRKCEVCGAQFRVKFAECLRKKFCSDVCKIKGQIRRRGMSVVRRCSNCGKEFRCCPSEQQRFCSQECYWKKKKVEFSGEGNHRWRGGHSKYRGPNWSEQNKRVLERDGYKCRKCGAVVGLAVHHIVRFEDCVDFAEANDENNLVTLCYMCHKAKGGIEPLYQKWWEFGKSKEEIRKETWEWVSKKLWNPRLVLL